MLFLFNIRRWLRVKKGSIYISRARKRSSSLGKSVIVATTAVWPTKKDLFQRNRPRGCITPLHGRLSTYQIQSSVENYQELIYIIETRLCAWTCRLIDRPISDQWHWPKSNPCPRCIDVRLHPAWTFLGLLQSSKGNKNVCKTGFGTTINLVHAFGIDVCGLFI